MSWWSEKAAKEAGFRERVFNDDNPNEKDSVLAKTYLQAVIISSLLSSAVSQLVEIKNALYIIELTLIIALIYHFW